MHPADRKSSPSPPAVPVRAGLAAPGRHNPAHRARRPRRERPRRHGIPMAPASGAPAAMHAELQRPSRQCSRICAAVLLLAVRRDPHQPFPCRAAPRRAPPSPRRQASPRSPPRPAPSARSHRPARSGPIRSRSAPTSRYPQVRRLRHRQQPHQPRSDVGGVGEINQRCLHIGKGRRSELLRRPTTGRRWEQLAPAASARHAGQEQQRAPHHQRSPATGRVAAGQPQPAQERAAERFQRPPSCRPGPATP